MSYSVTGRLPQEFFWLHSLPFCVVWKLNMVMRERPQVTQTGHDCLPHLNEVWYVIMLPSRHFCLTFAPKSAKIGLLSGLILIGTYLHMQNKTKQKKTIITSNCGFVISMISCCTETIWFKNRFIKPEHKIYINKHGDGKRCKGMYQLHRNGLQMMPTFFFVLFLSKFF